MKGIIINMQLINRINELIGLQENIHSYRLKVEMRCEEKWGVKAIFIHCLYVTDHPLRHGKENKHRHDLPSCRTSLVILV